MQIVKFALTPAASNGGFPDHHTSILLSLPVGQRAAACLFDRDAGCLQWRRRRPVLLAF
jgi:hypothetical protein